MYIPSVSWHSLVLHIKRSGTREKTAQLWKNLSRHCAILRLTSFCSYFHHYSCHRWIPNWGFILFKFPFSYKNLGGNFKQFSWILQCKEELRSVRTVPQNSILSSLMKKRIQEFSSHYTSPHAQEEQRFNFFPDSALGRVCVCRECDWSSLASDSVKSGTSRYQSML